MDHFKLLTIVSLCNTISTIKIQDFSGQQIMVISQVQIDKNARTLIFDDNFITQLPSNIFVHMSNPLVRTFQIENNGLTSVSSTAFLNTKLRQLKLQHNKLETFPDLAVIGSFLNNLYLEDNQIETIPCNVFQDLSALDHLDMTLNALVSYPRTCGSVESNLLSLDLNKNFINSIDISSLSGLTKLEILKIDLQDPKTSSTISNLYNVLPSSLKQLSIAQGKLRDKHVTEFAALTQSFVILNLKLNLLNTMPLFSVDIYYSLETLDLKSNRINNLGEDCLCPFKALKILNMDKNKIVSLTQLAKSCNSTLESLTLAENNIQNIATGTFQNLIILGTLTLSKNQITSFSILDSLYESPLHELLLDHNFLTKIPIIHGKMNNTLTVLDVSYNSITDMQNLLLKNYINLKELYLNNNNLSSIPQLYEAFSSNSYHPLSVLDLSYNKINIINSDAFKNLMNMSHLILSNNNISSFPTICILQSPLTHLFLDGNILSDFPKLIGILNETLEILKLSSNQIKYITQNHIRNLINLKKIQLDENIINYISNLSIFNNLIEITLTKITLFCDCKLIWLKQSKIISLSDFPCLNFPNTRWTDISNEDLNGNCKVTSSLQVTTEIVFSTADTRKHFLTEETTKFHPENIIASTADTTEHLLIIQETTNSNRETTIASIADTTEHLLAQETTKFHLETTIASIADTTEYLLTQETSKTHPETTIASIADTTEHLLAQKTTNSHSKTTITYNASGTTHTLQTKEVSESSTHVTESTSVHISESETTTLYPLMTETTSAFEHILGSTDGSTKTTAPILTSENKASTSAYTTVIITDIIDMRYTSSISIDIETYDGTTYQDTAPTIKTVNSITSKPSVETSGLSFRYTTPYISHKKSTTYPMKIINRNEITSLSYFVKKYKLDRSVTEAPYAEIIGYTFCFWVLLYFALIIASDLKHLKTVWINISKSYLYSYICPNLQGNVTYKYNI